MVSLGSGTCSQCGCAAADVADQFNIATRAVPVSAVANFLDAAHGIGVPSEAAAALEMGADAVLVNSAIALAALRVVLAISVSPA